MTDKPKPAEQCRPAEVFHVGEYLEDEMVARGWDSAEVARRMAEEGDDLKVNRLAIDTCLYVRQPGLILGRDLAERFARAFGSSAETWLVLDDTWQRWQLENTK